MTFADTDDRHAFMPQLGSNMCVCGYLADDPIHDELRRALADRDEWNDHLANEVSIHILAVPAWLRGPYLRRVEKLRSRCSDNTPAQEAAS